MWSDQRLPATTTLTPGDGNYDEAFESFLRRLDWTIIRPLAMQLGGDARSVVRGFGLELHELREYQPGDDVRRIDWNVTARTDRPFVRVSRVERALDVWLLVDVSASIDWGTAECLKRDRALEIAAVISYLLGRHGHRIGALPFAERPLEIIAPCAGRSHRLQLLNELYQVYAQRWPGRTDLAAALAHVSHLLPRPSLLLVISDLLVDDGWQAELAKLAQRHEIVVVRLRDPREMELPDVGLVTLEDPETGAQLIVDTSDRDLRERFRQAAIGQADRINAELIACGVEQLVISTDESLLGPLVRFLKTRDHLRRSSNPSAAQSPSMLSRFE